MLESLAELVWLFGALFLYLLLSLAVPIAIAAVIGLVGVGSVTPLLYVLPDVRRFLHLATGGDLADETPPWRVALRLRYLLLLIGFGVAYGFTFLVLAIPIMEFDLVEARVGPISILVVVPVAFVLQAIAFAFLAHRQSSAWTESTSSRSVLFQWCCS